MRTYLLIIFILLLYSCSKNNNNIMRLYYPGTNNIKAEITFKDSITSTIRDGIAKLYYPNGKIESLGYYVNDSLNGVYKGFDENGIISLEASYWKNKKVGPSKYYKNGYLQLYNEKDYSGGIYYVQKFDSKGNIIKEEGVSVSPVPYLDLDSNVVKSKTSVSLYFFYAEPDGYRNSLKAFINDTIVDINILPYHIASITKKIIKQGRNEFKLVSILKKNNNLISQDSCVKELYSY